MADDFKLRVLENQHSKIDFRLGRTPVAVSLGPHLLGSSRPHPDHHNTSNLINGMKKRIAFKLPVMRYTIFQRLAEFNEFFMNRYYSSCIFSADEAFETEEWLESCPYADYRKNELLNLDKNHVENNRDTDVNVHGKDENYPIYKHLRGIYARADPFKIKVGPFFKKLGNKVFTLPQYIKHVPIHKRPEYILNLCSKLDYGVFFSDFSSFEASWEKQKMSLRTAFYAFALQNHPKLKEYEKRFGVLKGRNRLVHRFFQAYIIARTMSGEMDTSLGNGYGNDLIQAFVCCVMNNNNLDEFMKNHGIEGDDNVACVKYIPTPEQYAELGFSVKLDVVDDITEAEFCGLIFDANDKHILTDPIKALQTFGWTTAQYATASDKTHLELLRAKSLSYLYQYPGCPILGELARYGLRVTKDVNVNKKLRMDEKTRYIYEMASKCFEEHGYYDECLNIKVGDGSRRKVEDKYDIPISMQLEIEHYLKNKNDLTPLNIPQIINLCHHDTIDYYNRFGYQVQFEELADIRISHI